MNKTYVMSDLHGNYESYRKMLLVIDFDDSDTLYILGDVCDRGPDSASIYLDVMERKNVLMIKGNHEKMALEALEAAAVPGGNCSDWFAMLLWEENGGHATADSLMNLSEEQRRKVLCYIKDLPWYRTLTLGDTEYIMVHAGLEEYDRDREISDYTPEELVWYSPEANAEFWPDENRILLVGHTPTFAITGNTPPNVYRGGGNVIFLDCGAAYPQAGGRLGCLCLETGEAYYV